MANGPDGMDLTFEAFAQHDFYRTVNEHLVDSALEARRQEPPSPISRVVDLACGTGAVTALIIDHLKRIRVSAEVIGMDPSESALEKARRLVGNAAKFVREGAQAVSSAVSGVDVILFCNAIHLLPDKDRVLREARKALNLEGVLGFNTSFYTGCYAPGTEKFYKLWMLRSLQMLKQDFGLRPDRSKVEAMRWLSRDEYGDLLRHNGFEIEVVKEEEALMTCESWQDISHYSEFANGALPGIPLNVAIPVLQRSVERAYAELKLTVLPRNWLQVVARAV